MDLDPRAVPIHVRRVVEADGVTHSDNEVYCAARGCSIPVAECETCGGYAGVDIDLYHHRNYILCRQLAAETTRGIEPAHPAVLRRRYLSETTAAERTPVSSIMTADIWCARDDLELHKLRAVLVERQISGVPVVDSVGHCIGVVSTTDLTRAAGGDTRVRDVMARVTFVLPDNASIAQAAALMALEHIHRIPIVTDDNKVAGIVSALDVLGWMARQDGYVLPH